MPDPIRPYSDYFLSEVRIAIDRIQDLHREMRQTYHEWCDLYDDGPIDSPTLLHKYREMRHIDDAASYALAPFRGLDYILDSGIYLPCWVAEKMEESLNGTR